MTSTHRPHDFRVSRYRFDVFKGAPDATGKIQRIRAVGLAMQEPGSDVFRVRLSTLLKDEFFVIPERRDDTGRDYSILTREPSRAPDRLYHWNRVGEGHLSVHQNSGFLALTWDLFGVDDIYMNLSAQALYR